jgi:uncharacterized protein
MKLNRFIGVQLFLCLALAAGSLLAGAPGAEWIAKIEELAPSEAPVAPQAQHKALIFSLMTGYKHSVTPYTTEVIRILGEKTGAYSLTISDDPAVFEADRIKDFDLVFLNNTCSKGEHRDLFYDATGDKQKAATLEDNLISHIRKGAGLVVLHGAIVMQNNSAEFSGMVGGSFDFHPANQTVVCKLVDPGHPLVAPFDGKPFVHKDEPYLFKNAYTNFNFRPLLEMDVARLSLGGRAAEIKALPRYVAWIKPYGAGRVFYCSPSHEPASFECPELLEFMLGGIQYAVGDLDCDDSPIGVARD